MDVPALIRRLRQSLAQCRSEAGMIVSDDELDAVQTARLERQQEVPPARAALAIGELDRQDLTAPVPVDADRDQHRLADDHAALAHPFGAVGVLGAALYNPIWLSAIANGRDVAIALVGFLLLERWRVPPLAIVVFCVGAALISASVS